MSWGKLDDGMWKNPKLRSVRPGTRWLYVAAISYSRHEKLDGRLNPAQVDFLVGAQGVPKSSPAELEQAQLWERDGAITVIHDYHDYSPATGAARQKKYRDAHRNITRDATSDVIPRTRAGGNPSPSNQLEKSLQPSLVPHNPPAGGVTVTVLNGVHADEHEAFVAELNEATGRRFRGSAVSRKLYAARRQDGYSADELLAAARGVALSKHHMGLNESSMPYNAPENVLRSKVLTQLIALGTGEIGIVRQATASEQREAEIAEWVARHDGGLQA